MSAASGTPRVQPIEAALVLADGEVFEGEAFGARPDDGISSGEVVFNTVLAGYQEVITDPSYAGQIVTFTYPHLGNYGVNSEDHESRSTFLRGVVCRDLPRRHSNFRAETDLESFLISQGVAGIAGIDTRRLTRHIRDAGAMPGAFGAADEAALRAAAAAEPGTGGIDLVATVTCDAPYHRATTRDDGGRVWNVVALDYGIKSTIVEQLSRIANVTVVPASTSAEDILGHHPDGVFLSNGPGDPEAVVGATDTIGGLLGKLPIFGICLGHQLLSLTLGLSTYKLPFGHHGGNHPIRNLRTGIIEITSQNHNFNVVDEMVDGVEVTHVNINDHTVAGIACTDVPAFSVQYHPEAGPGPHDSRYLFADFDAMLADFHGGEN
ncbi:MAG: glutamine-hydrolyzing carbamoyl-phosphate synthase small subunit [Actinomycetota bacterium]